MPDVAGELILFSLGAFEATSDVAAGLAGISVLGVSGPTIAGAGVIGAASIGLSYALANTSVPKPEDGGIALKQAIPPRQRGYWDCRLAGYYMLYEAGNRDSQDVMAFHQGPIDSIQHIYLHDDEVAVVPDVSGGGIGTVQTIGADQFAGGRVQVEFKLGAASQTAATLLTSDSNINTIWTTAFRGDGIAYGVLKCGAVADAQIFSKTYPQGLPLMSVVARCSPVWDPRDLAQDRLTSSTWVASPNPVLQLIDYLTREDGGMGLDYTVIIEPLIDDWMVEATFCDTKYLSAGWFRFDNSPEDIVNKILSTCDGYLVETGDGTLALTTGTYRDPAEDPIVDRHIISYQVNHGIADESLINQLDVSYTDPTQKYVQTQLDPVRDEVSISLTGVKSQPLDLSWVQDSVQAALLGARALLRLNPAHSGTIVTNLVGLRYIGKRWVKLQFTNGPRGLQNCVIEIQSAEIDMLAGRVSFKFNTVDTVALGAL